jgi:hypothetical protein
MKFYQPPSNLFLLLVLIHLYSLQLTQRETHTAILEILNYLEHIGSDAPTHPTFWGIRRAFDLVPKWLQRLAWALLGLLVDDLEWFINLESIVNIIIRTPYQQQQMSLTTDMLSGTMLSPQGNSFHPARGIGQGDTQSTLLFIAVFDILLTLLDASGTGKAHAYADDLVHIAQDLESQQRQANLVYEFCAFTSLEILLKKVEAVSINHGNIYNARSRGGPSTYCS